MAFVVLTAAFILVTAVMGKPAPDDEGSECLKQFYLFSLIKTLRVSVSKNQRNHGHGQKIDFAHTLSV